MKNTKPNLLKYVILFVILPVGAYYIYQYTKMDYSEKITPTISLTNDNSSRITPVKRTEHAKVTLNNNDEEVDIQKQRKAFQTNLKKSMNNALMLNTPEQIMKVIIHYQDSGDEEKENEYIDLLLKKFPDYNMN